MPGRMEPRVRNRLDILHYEVRMLNRVLQDPGRDPVEANARLESFLLHARNLLGFIQGKHSKNDDLTCTDFKDASGRPMGVILPSDEAWCKNLNELINKHLSHITTRRLVDKPDWNDLDEIRSRINALLVLFIRGLHSEEFGAAGEAGRQEFLTVLGATPSGVGDLTARTIRDFAGPGPGQATARGELAPRLQLPMEAIEALCRKYQVSELSIFGSALRADFGDSDIDLLVQFKPGARIGLEFMALHRELSEILGRDVDLVPKDSLKPALRDRVLNEAQVLYAA